MQPLIAQSSLVLLVSAALVFAAQTLLQLGKGTRGGASFPTVLLVVMIGWILTEVVTDALGTSLGVLGMWAHLSVMFLFAGAVTLQLKRARR